MISTRTVLLQHQIIHDIEVAQSIVGSHAAVRIAKGQGQYLCMRKLQDAEPDGLSEAMRDLRENWGLEHAKLVATLAATLRKQTRQTRARAGDVMQQREIHLYTEAEAQRAAEEMVSGPNFTDEEIDRQRFEDASEAVWSRVQIDERTDCRHCPLRGSCGWMRQVSDRQHFEGILVVNHGLLARDAYLRLAERPGLWPHPFATIVDEAHWIEDNLRREGALSVTAQSVRSVGRRAVGRVRAAALRDGQEALARFEEHAEQVAAMLERSIARSERETRTHTDADERKVQPFLAEPGLADAIDFFNLYALAVGDQLIIAREERLQDELEAISKALGRISQWLHDREKAGLVAWLERRSVFVGDLHLDAVTEVLTERTTVFASGTLGIGDDFELIERTLGLDATREMPRRLLRLYAPSPFDYRRQMRYVLANDLADARKPDLQETRRDQLAAVIRKLTAKHGRVLVLFTSRRQLDGVQERLRDLQPVLADGDASAVNLANKFRALDRGVYLSTASWDGLDAPGTGAVVIAQLPYPVPDDPWVEAKSRLAESAGQEKFTAVITPMMLMRLLQGVGRLIRRDTDKGTVYILDARAADRYEIVLESVLPASRATKEAVLDG